MNRLDLHSYSTTLSIKTSYYSSLLGKGEAQSGAPSTAGFVTML
jgi:hypothetical protein